MKEISLNEEKEKILLNYNNNTQIFIFNIRNSLSVNCFKDEENFAEEFDFEKKQIIRLKEIKEILNDKEIKNYFLVALNSSINIKENFQKIIANKNIINNKIEVKFMNWKFLLEKRRSYDGYANEFNNLKAKDIDYRKSSLKNSRHNSNISWRKESNKENYYKKGNFINEKKHSLANSNYNSNYQNSFNDKRERFHSEMISNFNANSNGKFNNQKSVQKNSFSKVNNI